MDQDALNSALANDDVLALSTLARDPNFKAAVQARDINGRSALHRAVAAGNTDCALFIIDSGVEVNTFDGQGETPLMRAAYLGQSQLVEALVESGADLNAQSLAGGTALHHAYAGSTKNQPVIDQLKALGANPDLLDKQGEPAEQWASQAQARERAQKTLQKISQPKRGVLKLSR